MYASRSARREDRSKGAPAKASRNSRDYTTPGVGGNVPTPSHLREPTFVEIGSSRL